MKNVVKIVFLIFTVVETAGAGSFTLETLPPAASGQASAAPGGNSYLHGAGVHTFAAARSFDNYGYIGTMHLNDTTTFNLSTGPTEVAVPEPATLVLFGSGLAVAVFRKRRRAHRSLHGRKSIPLST